MWYVRRYLRDTLDLVRRQIFDRTEDGGHRVIDPDVDRSESLFDLLPGAIDGIGISHVEGQHQSFAAKILHLILRTVLPVNIARDQADPRALLCEFPSTARPTPAEAPVITTTRLSIDPPR